jgi:predicted ATP-grasp superfamily ATP-dependent carboligase
MRNVFRHPTFDLDRSVPALLVKIGTYPVHAGGLGVVRTLGQAGVPVYAIVEDRLTPVALSRHLAGRFVWARSDRDDPEHLVERLVAIGRSLGRRAVAVPTDDEAAVLLAEHAEILSEYFLLPAVEGTLPRALASKRGLFELCRAHGVPTPNTVFPVDPTHLATLAGELTFPIVAKNVAPWTRLRAPMVPGTTLIDTKQELLDRFGGHQDLSGVLFQEYIPDEAAQDWFVHAYCDETATAITTFVGRKAYSWPPRRGVTADARSVDNAALAALTARFCRDIGYRGVNDLDWRYDARDARFKLVDFNPRVGAQFRFGQTTAGLDVVRALHLTMTGRPVPRDGQDFTRRLVVENVYLPARAAYRLTGAPAAPPPSPGTRTDGAWCEGSARDPLPLAMMPIRFVPPAIAAAYRLGSGLVRRLARRAVGRRS